MTAERPRRGKLTEFVTDHVFSDKHLEVLLTVVNHKCKAYELRHDGAGTRPCLDRIPFATRQLVFDLLKHARVDVGTLL